MKKLILILTILMFSVLPFTACGKKKNTIILNEVTHSVFYTPLYVAIEGGYFKEYGYDVKLINGGGADKTMTAVMSNKADIGLMGPESAIYTYLGGKKDYPKVFAQLTKKDGSFLISRIDEKDTFSWKNLENKEIIAGRRGGVPAMTLEYVLKNNSLIDGTNVTLNYDIQFNMTTTAFANGTGDYVTAFEPTASELESAGKGYVVASVGEASGEIPYTSFIASQAYLKNNPELIKNFLICLKRAYDYVYSASEKEIATLISPQFPSTPLATLENSVKAYKSIDSWVSDLKMSADSFYRLQDVMENAGELPERVNYDVLVDNTFVEEINK